MKEWSVLHKVPIGMGSGPIIQHENFRVLDALVQSVISSFSGNFDTSQ